MKNKQLFELKEAILKVKDKGDNKFKLPLILNEMKIDEQIKALEELRKPSKEFEEFQKERQELIAKHAEKDEQGNVLVYSQPEGRGKKVDNGYGFPNIVTDKKDFETSAKALEEKYKTTLEAEKKKQEDFAETLDQDCDIELKKIPFSAIPDLGYEDLKTLMIIIDENNEL